MTSHTDACQLIERTAHLARLGWAVEAATARGEVEVLIADLRDVAYTLTHEDLAHAVDKGGDTLDGPVTLTNEPTGDATRWTKEDH